MKENTWLITFPHAGGSSTIFKGWKKGINCNVLNLDYPGHWIRMREPLLDSFNELAMDAVKSIQNKIKAPADMFLFGHSLGAIMAWWITPILQEKGYTVKTIFLSACQSPNFFPEKNIIDANDEYKKLELIGYEEKDHSAIVNKQFLNTFFPILDKDLQICKTFTFCNHYVSVDSYIFYGKEDNLVDFNKMITWKDYVKLISLQEFTGRHLYLEDKNNKILLISLINKVLKELNQ